MSNFNKYKLILFDCDGVLLNSNHIKTKAFKSVLLPYGEKEANALVDYHLSNGGISRYKKFSYFLENIASQNFLRPKLEELLTNFSIEVKKDLMTCGVASGLEVFRSITPNSKWGVVSGGDQGELREVFRERNIDGMFDAGIFGSPDTKRKIFSREFSLIRETGSVLYIGDSKYDYKVAKESNFDFIFLSKWTDVTDWRVWIEENNINVAEDIKDLLNE